ncbi:glycosyltransferase family 2 protein [Streptomyces olivaceus]|uniref:glycosyltransferase family A protein n=1 Tax=Streptomyces olivaceus TaxID=47716 RepID=UPI001CCD5D67|nr:glycosyltransferase family A protein [Streptomyces olivaceus]MBZ6142457.1 glycosyltransferase family 2 protein [Streptomyces olivaceus]MBZ6170174.1 glycosyltransferase family 2 protein [Streptomyces olivaceus]MBZ6260594.1 glycosyltransferase family 2 protein [Streptomyces olivaceus]
MTRTISVITPVYDGGDAYLYEAYESLRTERLRLPEGWNLQWLVQEDGTTGNPTRNLPNEPWISPGMASKGGAGVARTMALPRATGELVRTLDADDAIIPGGLARDISTMEAHPELGWCISAGLDLLPDGSTAPGPYDPPEGPLSYERLLQGYDDDLFPVLGTHLTVKKPLLFAVGAWPAIPAWEAIAVVLCCAAVSDGWMIAAPGGYYRKHSGQTTAQATYSEVADESELRAIVRAQAEALRNLGWRWP